MVAAVVSSAPDSSVPLLTTVNAVDAAQVVGDQPDNELHSCTRWLVFRSRTFDRSLCYGFTLTNEDPYTIAYCIKTRDRTMFRLSEPYGIIPAKETVRLKLYLKKADSWSRSIAEYAGIRHQLCIENLRVPETVQPSSTPVGREMAKNIFKRTTFENPLQRLYWKMSIAIVQEKPLEESSSSAERVV